MKRRSLIIAASLLLVGSFTACNPGGGQQGTTPVTVTISSGSGAHKPGIGLRSKAMNPVASVRFTISGSGMDTITKVILVTPPQTVSQTINVVNGPSRTFLIEALDVSNTVVYSGSSIADLDGTPVTISLPLQIMIFNNLITSPWNDEARTIAQAQDSNGDLIIAGHTYGDLGGTNADPTHTTPDIFVSKLTSTGATLWTRQFGTSAFDICYSAATDSVGNIYLTGSTGGNLNVASKSGFIDAYVMKLGPSGNHLWTSLTGTVLSNTFSNAVVVDSAGNAYITGYTDKDLTGSGNAGGYDVFVAEYDTSGVLQWIQQQGSSEDDYGSGIALDAGGNNVYIAGSTHGGLLSSPTGSYYSNAGPPTTTDLFLMKYDVAGNWLWTTQTGTVDNDDALAVAVDPASGNVYVAGGTMGDLAGTGLTGSTDLFVVKFDAVSGNTVWSRQLGAVGSNTVANAIAVGPFGQGVVVTGYTNGDLDQPGGNAGLNDMFMVEYDQYGNLVTTQQYGTKADDYGTGIVIDNSGKITVVGITSGGFTSFATNILFDHQDVFLKQYDWTNPPVY